MKVSAVNLWRNDNGRMKKTKYEHCDKVIRKIVKLRPEISQFDMFLKKIIIKCV